MKTWEEAARHALELCMERPTMSPAFEPDLEYVQISLEELRSEVDRYEAGERDRHPIGEYIQLAEDARVGYALDLEDVLATLIKKQHDYGHKNITTFGHEGLCVRLHDKLARLENLAKRATDAKNESVQDTVQDIVGYCAIGVMLSNGSFTLPLAQDTLDEARRSAWAESVDGFTRRGWSEVELTDYIEREVARLMKAAFGE